MTMEHETGMQRVGSAGMAAFEPRDFSELERLAKRCIDSRLFKVASPDAALVIMLTGASLGLSPVAALRGIHVIEGKSVLSSDLLVAVVLKSGQCLRWTVAETTDERCVIETHRKGQQAPYRHTWTIAMARKAGLASKGNWNTYPAAMLRARCSSEIARIVYPDVMFGVFVEGELDADPATHGEAPAVTIVRDDAPAQLAAPDALAAFRDALDATEPLDLDGARVAYARHDLGGTSLSAVTVALVGALAVRGYRLTGTEAGQLLRGELSDALALAYDQLAAVTRHADDDDGDGVVADVVRVLRSPGVAGLAKAAKSRVMTVAVQTCAAHDVADGDVRIRAALAPTPPTTPTGTDGAPRAGTPATSAGGSVAPAESAGATMRLAPEAARTRDEWREYLEGKSSRTEIENAVRKYGRLSSDLVELAGWRLQAITPATQSGYRTPLRIHQLDVAAWAEEGPRKAAAQRRAAATVTTASQLGKAA
jgi:hypothetical protein